MSNLLETIKKASLDAVNNSQPMQITFGIVIAISPLKISLEQKLALEEAFIIVPKEFTKIKRTIKIKLEQDFEDKEIEIDNTLKVGDKVILLKMQGGQKYLVLSRMVSDDDS